MRHPVLQRYPSRRISCQEDFVCLVSLDRALTHDDSGVSIQTHLEIIDLEFSETDVACHAFQVFPFVHGAAVRPHNCAIFRLESPGI